MSISWKKRLLAVILALVMVMGDVPTGLIWPNSGRVTAEIVEDEPAAPVFLEGTDLSEGEPVEDADDAPAQPAADSPADVPAAEEPAVPATEPADGEGDQSSSEEAPAQKTANASEDISEGENELVWGGCFFRRNNRGAVRPGGESAPGS